MDMEQIARWSYTAFVIIAIVAGLAVGYMAYSANLHWSDSAVADTNGWITLVLLILGIIIGLTSITMKEVGPFLTATIAIIVASIANVWYPLTNIHELLYYWATGILNYIVAFAAPAAVIIAIKAILTMAREK
jgi:FtsH-binding integral membrane protein